MMRLTPIEVRVHPQLGEIVLDYGRCVPRACPVDKLYKVLSPTHRYETPTGWLGDMPSLTHDQFGQLPLSRYIN
jgi:hypothetical protein